MRKALHLAISLTVSLFFVVKANSAPEPIEIKTTAQGGYTLYVKGQPFLIKGVLYNPTPVEKGYDYDLFSDENKPWLVDGKLMKEMGINCIRIYSAGPDLEKVKEFIKEMYENFGIYTMVGDWLGLWSYPAANYADKEFQELTMKRVLTIVNALKDEEGVLIWILGNENNYTFSGKIGFWTSPEIEKIESPAAQIAKKAEIYYSLVDRIAAEIKKIDPAHPVVLSNGEASFLDVAARVCQNIDALAIIAYRGKKFGNFFSNFKNIFDKPLFNSEFGCDSYDADKDKEDQDVQVEFLLSQWQDLYKNTTFSGNNEGNCLGGVIFEWTDEWWKHNESYTLDWSTHNKEAGWSEGSYYFDINAENNLNMNEEWFGLVSMAPEQENGINKRTPKKACSALKEFFSNPPQTK